MQISRFNKEPVWILLLIAACAGCGLAIGLVMGNCMLTCHEMFRQDT